MPTLQREITKKLGNPKQPTNPFLEMIKFLLERIAPVHIDTESIRYFYIKTLYFNCYLFVCTYLCVYIYVHYVYILICMVVYIMNICVYKYSYKYLNILVFLLPAYISV